MNLNTNDFELIFKEEAGKLTSSLLCILGADKIDIVENVVQDTFIKAMKNWPINGRPDNPGAWLRKVAKNLTMDYFRRGATQNRYQDTLKEDYGDKELENYDLSEFEKIIDEEIVDEQLRYDFFGLPS